MFESPSPDALLSVIEAGQPEESAVMARRMATIAGSRTNAEVSAALKLSPMGSRRLVSQAEALDPRLPKVDWKPPPPPPTDDGEPPF